MQSAQIRNDLSFIFHPFTLGNLLGEIIPDRFGDFEPRRIQRTAILIFHLLEFVPSQIFGVAAEDNIRSSPCHVGGDRDGTFASSLRNGLGFTLGILGLGIQQLVPDTVLCQFVAELFRILDRNRSQQDGAAGHMHFFDFFNNRSPFFGLSPVDGIGISDARQRAIRRNGNHIKVIDFDELGRFRHGRTGHPRKFFIQLEKILQGDGRKSLRFFLNPHPFFRFHRLMQTVAPLTTFHHTTGMLIDDRDFITPHDIVHIPFVQMVCPQRIVDQMRPLHVPGGVKALDSRQFFR